MRFQAQWYFFPQQRSQVMAVTMAGAGRKSGYEIVEWLRSRPGREQQLQRSHWIQDCEAIMDFPIRKELEF